MSAGIDRQRTRSPGLRPVEQAFAKLEAYPRAARSHMFYTIGVRWTLPIIRELSGEW
jgi:hypothetical protein